MKPRTITSHGIPKQPPGRGPNGRRFCRWCHAEVPKGRSSYCNDECRKHADFGYSKWFVLYRVGRKCAQCGSERRTKVTKWGSVMTTRGGALEIDHIIAVKDGGTHHPDNLRTLCHECHCARTKEQAGERAAKRREAARTAPLFVKGKTK